MSKLKQMKEKQSDYCTLVCLSQRTLVKSPPFQIVQSPKTPVKTASAETDNLENAPRAPGCEVQRRAKKWGGGLPPASEALAYSVVKSTKSYFTHKLVRLVKQRVCLDGSFR